MNPFEVAPNTRKTLTLVGLYMGLFAMILMAAGLSTILPVAATDIGGLEIYPLASTIGGLLSVAGMPLVAYFGAKRPDLKRLLSALCLFAGSLSVFVWAMAPSMTVIIIAGLFQGFISVGIYVLGYSMVRDMFEQVRAGVLLGAFGTVMGIGMLVGPLIVGALLSTVGWRACFHVMWPLLLTAGILILCGVKVSREQAEGLVVKGGSFDFFGAASMVVMLVGLILSLSLGASFVPFGTPLSWLLVALALMGLICLSVSVRRRGSSAIIPITVLSDHNTRAFAFCNFLNGLSQIAVFFFIPVYVLNVMGAEPIFAAMTISVYSVMNIFVSPIFGRFIGKTGNARIIHTTGTAVRIVVALTLLFALSPTLPVGVAVVIMFVAGFYSSVQTSVFSAGPMIQIRPEIRTQANSVIQIAMTFGSTAGMAVFTFIMAYAGIAGGMPIAMGIAAGAAALSLVSGLFLRKLDDRH